MTTTNRRVDVVVEVLSSTDLEDWQVDDVFHPDGSATRRYEEPTLPDPASSSQRAFLRLRYTVQSDD